MAELEIELNQPIPSVSKKITQESINQFESCGILDRQNIHNNPELAKQRLGFAHPLASGRMSVAFAAESQGGAEPAYAGANDSNIFCVHDDSISEISEFVINS